MVRHSKKLFVVAVSTIVLLVATRPVNALGTIHLSWADYVELAAWDAAHMAFVAEGRIGDRGGAATFEIDVGYTTGSPAVTAQYAWVSGTAESFTLSFNAATKLVTWTIGATSVSFTYSESGHIPISTLNAIIVRARSDATGQSMLVTDLVLNGQPVGDQVSAVGAYPGTNAPANTPNDGLDLLYIGNVAFISGGFTLTGTATMTWGATVPTQSRLAFQIKVGDPTGLPPIAVGGVIILTNPVIVLMPYLTIFGLVAAAGYAAIRKRR